LVRRRVASTDLAALVDDDVQNVFANFEVSEEVLKKLTAA
jgi:hypothetical protein